MRTPGGRSAGLSSLLVTVVGLLALGGLQLVQPASSDAAPQVGTARPVAIAVDARGTSYVGYASGDALSVVSSAGKVLAPVVLDQDGPVVGLAVDGGSRGPRIWVDYGDSVSALSPRGVVLAHWGTGVTCADDTSHSAIRYGGLAVTGSQVFVADRCDAVVRVYQRGGAPVARLALPGGHQARGLAWLRATGTQPARLFVAVPDSAALLTYDADRLGASARPIRTTAIARPTRGSARPVPAGVVVDRHGNVGVSDLANQAVYLYSTSRGAYSRYRTLGHPTASGSGDGYLRAPSAIAQYPQDGGHLSGNLFIADTGHGRVQRWDSGGGYTYWVRPLRQPTGGTSPSDPGTPVTPVPPASGLRNTRRPTITPDAGHTTLYCDPGTWTATSASYGYQWRRDGAPVGGAGGSTYLLTPADDGHELVCRVTATTVDASVSADSAPTFVGTAVRPVNVTPPSIVGTARRGSTLGCATGTWSGAPAPSYAFQWLRGGVPVADTPTHVVVTADVGRSLSCTVTASNTAGAGSASSASVVPTDDAAPPDPSAACVGTPAVLIAGGDGLIRDPGVLLTVAVPADATGLEIANGADFAGAVPQELSPTCRYSWTLVAPATDAGLARVYVRWVGGSAAGQVVSDAVRFDRSGPVLSAAIVRFQHRHWLLRVSGSDASGIARVQYAERPVGGTVTAIGAGGVVVASPHAAAYVRAFDALGNVGPWLHSS